jgi:hypothetical protein
MKRKVSTIRGSALRKRHKILKCLADYPEGTTPKTIARHTSLNVNTVKSILPKLTNVRRTMRGFYKVLEGGDGGLSEPDVLRDWCFHNLVLSCELTHCTRRVDESYALGLVGVSFTLSKSGRASLRLSCDWPLNVSSICLVYGFFRNLLGRYSSDAVGLADVFVRTVEFNKDYSNLRLDGVKCISLDSLCVQFKAYQKRRGLRIEHKTKVPFSVENIVEMLSSNPNGLEHNLKLVSMKKLLDRQAVATEANTRMLYKLIENMKTEVIE